MKFKGDIIITDPCYIVKEEDWENSDFGENMDVIGFTSWLSRSTGYGDWSCTTFKHDISDIKEYLEELVSDEDVKIEGNKIGTFCADAGMVGVFLVDEVLEYNPEFKSKLGSWWLTYIKDFDGDINFYVTCANTVHVIGEGNINFYTIQTGF